METMLLRNHKEFLNAVNQHFKTSALLPQDLFEKNIEQKIDLCAILMKIVRVLIKDDKYTADDLLKQYKQGKDAELIVSPEMYHYLYNKANCLPETKLITNENKYIPVVYLCLQIISQNWESMKYHLHQGLKNFGSNCYFNTALQLIYTAHLYVPALFKAAIQNNNYKSFGELYLNTLIQMIANTEAIDPFDLFQELSKHKPEYQMYVQKDMFQAIIETLNLYHQSINISKESKSVRFEPTPTKPDIDEAKKMVIKHENSPIYEIFSHVGLRTYKCTNQDCNDTFYKCEMGIGFILEMSSSLNLNDMVKEFLTQEETYSGFNCKKCQKVVKCNISLRIKYFPQILLILIKRFQLNFKTGTYTKRYEEVKFEKELNLDEYTDPSEKLRYQLVGVGNHSGTLDGGHYFAQVFDKVRNEWLCANDSYITPIEESAIYTSNAIVLEYIKVKL